MIQTRQTPLRRIAFSEVVTTEGKCLTRYVIELSAEGWVERLFPLTQELPHTEWCRGRVELMEKNGHVCAYYHNKPITTIK